jgi:hypothetical protein
VADPPAARPRRRLTGRQIEEARLGTAGQSFSSGQQLLLRATDELHADRVLSDTTWAGLCSRYEDARIIEFCMLAGHYEMLAMTVNSLGVQPDHGLTEPPRPMTRLLQRIAGRGRPVPRNFP